MNTGISYDREQIKELCDQFNLFKYVDENYDVAKYGNEECMVHCPKHRDEHASLSINAKTGNFYCHSCHRGGGPIQWFMKMEDLSFAQAVDKLSELTGLEVRKVYKPSSLKFFNELKSIDETQIYVPPERQLLTEDYYDQFEIPPDGEPSEWIQEGIPQEMIWKYDIRLDLKGNRIVYKVYDSKDNFIGVKGRTRFSNYKILGLTKYINYQKIAKTDYLQGMHENRQNILESGECIILEGLKSVMKVDGFGYNNAVSAETSVLNDDQARILIELGCHDIVFAFDQDVSFADALKSVQKVKHWANCYVVYDREGLLQPKDSPCDRGKEIWDRLYKERRKVV